MKISDEAVQAAARKDAEMSGRTFDALSASEKKRYLLRSQEQLTAALPFLTGVKVKALEWDEASGDYYSEGSGTHYNIYETRPDFWNCVTVKPGNVRLATNVSLEAAKAAAQADYEARVLSAIEPAQSPRAQALEEAAGDWPPLKQAIWRVLMDENLNDGHYIAAFPFVDKLYDATIYALSSQPVADGWLPIETAPKDGTWVLAFYRKECVPAVVFFDEENSQWRGQDIGKNRFTHWRPLPASPGAAE